ncbi:MAG: dual specificity protein phosphatase family protein, partial [Bryobacteraceae bacterium]
IGGEVLAVVTFYLLAEGGSPLPRRRWTAIRPKLAWIYGAAAGVLALSAAIIGGWWTLLLWPAVSLALVCCAYSGAGAAVFQKRNGRLSWPAAALLAPYLLGALVWLRINRHDPYAEVAPGLYVGRRLHASETRSAPLRGVVAVLDATAEHYEAAPFRKLHYKNVQLLDLTAPDIAQLREAVAFIREQIPRGDVYVHCALGISRSCGVAAAYLLAAGIEDSVESAIARVQRARPRTTLGPKWRALLAEFHAAMIPAKAAAR